MCNINTSLILHDEQIQNYRITAKLNPSGGLTVKVHHAIDLANNVLVWQDNNILSARIFVSAQLYNSIKKAA